MREYRFTCDRCKASTNVGLHEGQLLPVQWITLRTESERNWAGAMLCNIELCFRCARDFHHWQTHVEGA